MSTKLITTDDGCHSLISEEFGVAYHSHHGALIETEAVFINMGLRYLVDKGLQEIDIFEMGFGTGLNALRTYIVAEELGIKINYTAIEAYPLPKDEYSQLNFDQALDYKCGNLMAAMQEGKHLEEISLNPNFTFKKIISKIEEFDFAQTFDLVYYDAFAPSSQPHLWEEPIISKMYDILKSNGVLVTYCAKGVFKRLLKSLTFTVENLPGPGRKREITRAIKASI
jgi:tRNA U34 5-methylaminomethyl-2-thiouridine-forming methyltransferase MnmC